MLIFRDLSIEDCNYHFGIAKSLIPGDVYSFDPQIEVLVPVSDSKQEKTLVSFGQFVRWREEGQLKDCLFLVQFDRRILNSPLPFESIVSILFRVGTQVTKI